MARKNGDDPLISPYVFYFQTGDGQTEDPRACIYLINEDESVFFFFGEE